MTFAIRAILIVSIKCSVILILKHTMGHWSSFIDKYQVLYACDMFWNKRYGQSIHTYSEFNWDAVISRINQT